MPRSGRRRRVGGEHYLFIEQDHARPGELEHFVDHQFGARACARCFRLSNQLQTAIARDPPGDIAPERIDARARFDEPTNIAIFVFGRYWPPFDQAANFQIENLGLPRPRLPMADQRTVSRKCVLPV